MGLFSLAEVNRPKATGTLDGEPHSKVILPGTGGKLTDQQTKDANAGSLQRLVEFIPLESITLFWLAVPAANALAPAEQKREWYWGVYVGVMILTPLFLLLVYWSRKAILKDVATSAEQEAADEVDQERVGRAAQNVVKDYFGSLSKDEPPKKP